jgi:hypothetical protein
MEGWIIYIYIFLYIKNFLHKFSNCQTFTYLIDKNLDVDPVPNPQNRTFFNSQYSSSTTHERYAFFSLDSETLVKGVCCISNAIKKSSFDGGCLKISKDRLLKWPMDCSRDRVLKL